MQITITARNLEITEPLKRYAEEKIARLQKFVNQITSAHVILSVEKHRQIAEVTLHVREHTIRGEESSADLYSAIDLVADKIERQILRYKEKIRRPLRSRLGAVGRIGRAYAGRWRIVLRRRPPHRQDQAFRYEAALA